MAGGKSAKRAASDAAAASREEAARYREATAMVKQRTEQERLKAQRLLMRSLRSRGTGIFESDFISTLGGQGTLG